MGKQRTRVEEEAREVEQRAAEVERQIKQLATQVSNPQKYFRKPDERSRSAAERFRRYLGAGGVTTVEKRKPTRAEMRAQRSKAIVWLIVAFIALIWMIGKLTQLLQR